MVRRSFRSFLATICIASVGVATLTIGETAKGATPSPLVYAINPFGNEPGYPGLIPFQLSTGAVAETKVLTVTTGPLAGEPLAGGNGLAQDPTNDVYYAVVKFGAEFDQGLPRRLATVDVATGIVTPIGSGLTRQIAGITFRSDGTLYGVSGDGDPNCEACLFEIDKTTGALTFLKALGTGDDGVNGICCGEAIGYNPIDDMIYHSSHHWPETVFRKIDPDNAFAITDIPLSGTGDGPDEVTGIGFDGTNFVMTDFGPDVWSVTPAGAYTKVTAADGEFFYRGLVVGDPITVLDYGDAPDGVGTPPQNAYPTLQANNGASHIPVGPKLGNLRDAEADGLPTTDALGDDQDGLADEDGVVFHNDFLRGEGTELRVSLNTDDPGAELDAWIDFNRDGDWNDPDDRIFEDRNLVPGTNELSFTVPPTSVLGATFARFRVSTNGTPNPLGDAIDGEVEDYALTIRERAPGQKFRCGQEVKGRVKLTTDLLDCPEHGLIVVGRETKVNLNGHTIDGISSRDSRGILNRSGKPKLVVKGNGGLIQQFGKGIDFDGCGNEAQLIGVEVDTVVLAGIDICGNDHVLDDITVSNSARDGIRINGKRVILSDSTVSASAENGIATFDTSSKVKVVRNIVVDSGSVGINLNTPTATVKDNDMTNSDEAGLIVNNGADVPTIVGSGNDTNGDTCLPTRLCAT